MAEPSEEELKALAEKAAAVQEWMDEFSQRKSVDLAASVLATGLVLQRIAIDELNDEIDNMTAPKPEYEMYRKDVIGAMYSTLRDMSYQPADVHSLLDQVKHAGQAARIFLKRKERSVRRITSFDLTCEDEGLRDVAASVGIPGTITLFKGSDVAAWAAMSLFASMMGKQNIPMFLLGGEDPFTRALVAQEFTTLMVINANRGVGLNKDRGSFIALLKQVSIAGCMVVSNFYKFLNKDMRACPKITNEKLFKTVELLGTYQKNIMGWLPADSSLKHQPEHGIFVYDVSSDMVATAVDSDESHNAVTINGYTVKAPKQE